MDAAVATAAALNVVEPYMSGLAGCGVMLVSSARRRERVVLDYTGVTPQAADPGALHRGRAEGGPEVGRHAGQPRRLARGAGALRLDGAPAGPGAGDPAGRGGVPALPQELRVRRPRARPSSRAPRRRGESCSAGARCGRAGVFVQADLGRTLRQIAEGGAEVLYGGPLGRTIARAVQAPGGWLDEADLAACRPAWQTPIAGGFRGLELLVPPPPCVVVADPRDAAHPGGLRPEGARPQLARVPPPLRRGGQARLGRPRRPTRTREAVRRAGAPGSCPQAYAASQRERLDRVHAGASGGERFSPERLRGEVLPGHPADFLKEQTTHFAAADPEMVVSVTQSLGSPFGSGFVAPGTGVFLNNFLYWTDLEPASPNYLRGGRRDRADDEPDPGVPRRAVRPVDRDARVLRHPPDHAPDDPQPPRVRHGHPGGHRGAAGARLPGPAARRRGAVRGGAPGARWPPGATR